jgi:hypothetical protein
MKLTTNTKPVKQEDELGCVIACVAFILNLTYKETIKLFENGKQRAKEIPNFYCPEIVEILNQKGLCYAWIKLDKIPTNYPDQSLVFIKANNKLPFGHFLVRHNNTWIDSWINLPSLNIQAGFRKNLPGVPSYLIFPKEQFYE